MFTAPVLVAYALNVWWPQWSPFGRMNHGVLVEPAWEVDLESVVQHSAGRWILLHPAATPCDHACEVRLELTKRVHVSLGKDYTRVVRMFVHRAGLPVERLRSMDAELILLPAPDAWFDRFAGDEPALLIVDPQRQTVLRYDAALQPKGLARDLARVLKISKIG